MFVGSSTSVNCMPIYAWASLWFFSFSWHVSHPCLLWWSLIFSSEKKGVPEMWWHWSTSILLHSLCIRRLCLSFLCIKFPSEAYEASIQMDFLACMPSCTADTSLLSTGDFQRKHHLCCKRQQIFPGKAVPRDCLRACVPFRFSRFVLWHWFT